MENQNVILNLENIEEVLVRNGININNLDENQKKLYMFLMQEIRNTTVKVQQKDREINDLRTQIQFTNATTLHIQNQQTELARSLNITDQNLANTNTHLNNVDARLTLTEQNLNLLKDKINEITRQAVRNNTINIPEPMEGESIENNFLDNFINLFKMQLSNE